VDDSFTHECKDGLGELEGLFRSTHQEGKCTSLGSSNACYVFVRKEAHLFSLSNIPPDTGASIILAPAFITLDATSRAMVTSSVVESMQSVSWVLSMASNFCKVGMMAPE